MKTAINPMTSWLMRMIFILVGFFVFQNSIFAISSQIEFSFEVVHYQDSPEFNDDFADQFFECHFSDLHTSIPRVLEPENANIKGAVNLAAKTSTDFVSNVTAKSFGKDWGQGTVNVGKTINAIRTGSLKPAGVYNNIEKHAQLLGKPKGYWQKYELLEYGRKAPLRIIKGGKGELFLTPDHDKSLIPLGGL